MSGLTKFNNLYNKFIYQWTEQKSLSDIIKDFNEAEQQNNVPIINNTEQIQQNKQLNQSINDNTENIKQNFYTIFPKYLIKKCQNKFPIDDETNVPINIIDQFWKKCENNLIEKLANIALDSLASALYDTLISIYGKEDEYNEELCNKPALAFVKQI